MAETRDFVKLEGLADLKANLEALGTEVATRVGQRANNRAAKVMAEAIRKAAPVSDIPSGATRHRKNKGGESVAYQHHKIRDEIKVRKGRARKENVVVTNVTSGKAFHAKMVENGTSRAGPHPFWRPASDAAAGDARAAQIDELRKGIERQAKRSKIRKPD